MSEIQDRIKEQFIAVLKEFATVFQDDLTLDEESDTAVLVVDEDVIINFVYLNDSDTIVMTSPVGGLDREEDQAGDKALALLKLTDLTLSQHVTLMLDPEEDLVLAADRRSALSISTEDELSGWLEFMVATVRSVRAYFAEHFPLEEA